MAKNIKIELGEIQSIFSKVNIEGAELVKNIDAILVGTRQNLSAMKEYMNTWKAVNSQSIKDLNATMAQSSKLIQTNNTLTVEQIRIEKEIQKTLEQTNKTKMSANKLAQQEAQIAAKALKEKEKLNNLYGQESARLNKLRNDYKNLTLSQTGSRKEMRSMLSEITSLDNKLKKLDATVGQNQRNVGNYSGALRGAGRSIAGILGVGIGINQIGSFISKSAQDFREFDSALKEVSAITGLAGNDLDKLKKRALEVGKSGKAGATEYLEAIKLIGSASPALLKDSVALQKFADDAITLKQAAKIDLTTAADAITAAKNQFNLGVEDSTRIINALAAGSLEGSAEVQDLTESFKNVGTVAADANLTLEQTVAALEVLAEKQLKGAEAGTKLRGAIAQLKKNMLGFGSGKFNLTDALNDAQKVLNGIQDPAKKAAKSLKLFGVENEVAGKILLGSIDKYEKLTKSVTGTNVAFQQAATNQESAAAASERLNNELQAARIEIGENLLPALNALKSGLISVITFVSELFEAFNDMKAAVRENKAAFDDLKTSYENGEIGTLEYAKTAFIMSDAMKELRNSTEETKVEGAELIKQFQTGKMSLTQFGIAVEKLRILELKRRQQKKKATEEDKKNGVTDGLGAETGVNKEAAKLANEAFEKEKNLLDLRKTNAEIFINTTVDDEKERVRLLAELNIDYLSERAVIEKTYNKDYRKTILEKVNADIAEEKRKIEAQKAALDKIIEIQNKLDAAEIEATEDPRSKEEKQVIAEYEGRIAGLNEMIPKENELIIAYKEELVRKLKAIDEKYAAEQDELEAEQAANKIAYEEYAANKKKELQQKDIDFLKETFSKTIDAVEAEINRENQLREDAIDKRIDDRQNEIERQQDLASRGKDNQLAFEKQKLAEDQLAKRQLQEKEIRQQKIIAFWRAYASYVQSDPKTAITNTLSDIAVSTIVSAAFWDGTEKVSEDAQFNKNKFSSGRDGYVARFDGSERILSGEQNSILGNISNEELVERALLPGYIVDQPGVISVGDHSAVIMAKGLMEMKEELSNIKQAIHDKPENYADLSKLGHVIETRVHQGLKKIIRHIPMKKRL